jgi:phosphoenolpyruvate carboxykinase (GTP)
MGAKGGAKMPKIFYVNWFRKKDGRFMWPGYAENSRVLKWVFERCEGTGAAVDTPIGRLPAAGALDTGGLKISAEDLSELNSVDEEGWKAEIPSIREHFATFGEKLPAALSAELDALERRLG